VLLYAPIRVYEIYPKCGPSKGGTMVQIVGTGFSSSEKLRVRFTYGDLSREVYCQYNPEDKSILCKTPIFEEFEGETHPSLQMPCDCFLSVTMDGINYSECEVPFKIYSNDIYLTAVNPKCGSVSGGTQVTLNNNIDEETAHHLQDLKIGFQPKKSRGGRNVTHETGGKGNAYQSRQSVDGSQHDSGVKMQQLGGQSIHEENNARHNDSADLAEQDQWVCAEGFYEDGRIIATVPGLQNFNPDNLGFSVDVALNGQQFTGRAVNFRYYDIEIESVEPNFGPSNGGTNILILGKGLYDAGTKRIKFSTEDGRGSREVQADWDRKIRAMKVTVPPYDWLFADEEEKPESQHTQQNEDGEEQKEE